MTLRPVLTPRRFSPSRLLGWAGTLLFTAALCLGYPALSRAQLPGTVDPAFAPTVRANGSIAFIATQADGKQLIGGYFSRVGAVTEPSLARLNTDGSLDTGFVAPTGLGAVDYIVAQADGKVLVLLENIGTFGSNFTLVRLDADGSQDSGFSPPSFGGEHVSNELYPFVVAVQSDGKVLVGGGFVRDPASSITVHTVIRYNADGSLDSGFQLPSTPTGQLIASLLPLSNGQLLVSGSFTTLDRSGMETSYSLLRFNADGSRDSSYPVGSGQNAGYGLTLQPDGKLLSLAESSAGNVYPGGMPQRLNADGSVDTSFAPHFSTTVGFSSLVLQPNGKVLLGGLTAIVYPASGGEITTQSGVARVNADGSVDATFNPVTPLVDGSVTALGLQPNGQILVGGNFLNFAGAEHGSLGRLNADGSLDTTYHNEITNVGNAYGVAVLPNGQPLLADSGLLVNGALATNLVSFNANGSLGTAFAASLAPAQGFYSGAALESTNAVLAVQADGKALLAGIFDPFSGYYVPALNRYNVDGSLDSTFTYYAGVYGALNAVDPQADGHIYVAGQVNAGYDRYTYPLDRLNADGSIDNTFSPATDPAANGYRSSTIYSLAVQPDGKVIAAGGFLTPLGGSQQSSVQRFNTDGSVDTSFNAGLFTNSTYVAGAVGFVKSLGLQPDGKVVVAGGFTSIGGVVANDLARLNADGSLDPTFNAGTGAAGVASMVVQANGEILIGGGFTSVNGVALNGVARLEGDGSVDPLFFPGTGTGGTGFVNSLALAPGGSVFVGGTFSEFDGQARDGIARLNGGDIVAPAITSATTATAQVGQAITYQITASNTPTSFAATGLPGGLSVSSGTGIITGTPTQAGTSAVTIFAANLAGTGSTVLTLTVNPAAPVITSNVAVVGQVGQPFAYQIAASSNPTSFGATAVPAGLAFSATGLISGTPTAAGTFSFTISATNAGGTGAVAVTLTVLPPAPQVTLIGTSASAQVGQVFSYQIAATNTPTSYGATGLPAGLSVSAAAGVISGTPSAAGTFKVTLSAANSGGTGSAMITLIVLPALPVATLVATTPTVTAGTGEIGEFTLSLSAAPSSDVVVNLAIKGTAVDGTDYVLLKMTKKIKAGQTSKPIKVIPQGNLGGVSKKTVKLVLEPGTGYMVGTTGKVKVSILAGQ